MVKSKEDRQELKKMGLQEVNKTHEAYSPAACFRRQCPAAGWRKKQYHSPRCRAWKK